MNELISSASLLLALIGVIYGVWYKEISCAINVEVKKFVEDRDSEKSQVNEALFQRALPLSLASGCLSIIFLPTTINIIRESLSALYSASDISYNPVKATFCFVEAFLLAFSIHIIWLTKRVFNMRSRLYK